MRYQDWDVILFPGESNIPFQEFRTSCLCTQDPGMLHRFLSQHMNHG